jgi:hypothetical protein
LKPNVYEVCDQEEDGSDAGEGDDFVVENFGCNKSGVVDGDEKSSWDS